MKIEKRCVPWRWGFETFSRDTPELNGRNLNCWRNFVGIGPQNFARDAIISHAFQTALDAPFGDPHRKMRLKAGHSPPLSHLQEIQDERIADNWKN